MFRQRRWLPLLLATIVSAAAAGAAGAGTVGPKLRVKPGSGRARTTFTVHFTAPQASGRSAGRVHSYRLAAAPGRRRRGCIDSVSVNPVAATSGEAMAVRLVPKRLGGRWCVGTYSGRVTETSGPACGPPVGVRPAIVCPDTLPSNSAIVVATLGTFSFRVHR